MGGHRPHSVSSATIRPCACADEMATTITIHAANRNRRIRPPVAEAQRPMHSVREWRWRTGPPSPQFPFRVNQWGERVRKTEEGRLGLPTRGQLSCRVASSCGESNRQKQASASSHFFHPELAALHFVGSVRRPKCDEPVFLRQSSQVTRSRVFVTNDEPLLRADF